MEAWVDYYNILNVHERADRDSIESVYRSLCKMYHPDINHSPEVESLMKEINLAWEILKDDRKRRLYDIEWARRSSHGQPPPNGWAAPENWAGPNGRTAPNARTAPGGWSAQRAARDEERRVHEEARRARAEEQAAWQRDHPNADAEARAAVSAYFDGIAHGRFLEMYDLLCTEDRQGIPLESFIEWQTSVAGSYHIERFSVEAFRDYEKFPVDERYYKAKRFTLAITERNVRTGEWTSYRLTKFVLEQEGKWRVYLGYRNLDPIITQFAVLTGTTDEAVRRSIDLPTGLPNRRGFLEKCKAEVYRYERYHRDCAIAVATVESVRSVEEDVRQKMFAQAAYSLRAAVRLIDLVGALGQGRFTVLLAECDAAQARSAVRRISRRMEREALACFDSSINIKWKVRPFTGGDIGDLLTECEK